MLDTLAEIREAFLAAPAAADGWEKALHTLSLHTGSSRAQIVAFGNDCTIPFDVMTNVDAAWHREVIEIDGANPEVNWRVALQRQPFEIVSDRHYDAVRGRFRGNIYDEFAIRHDMVGGCQTVLLRQPDAFYGLACIRARSDGRTSEAQLAVFEQAAPYAYAAVRMQNALESNVGALAARTLAAVRSAAFVLDCHGMVIDHTAQADSLLSTGCYFHLTARRLYAVKPEEQRQLERALARVAEDAPSGDACATFWLSGEPPYNRGRRCDIFRLPGIEWALRARPLFLVVVRSRRPADPGGAILLQNAFHLSAAEAEVALLLAEGHSRDEIAAMRQTRPNTVYAQTKTIFDKLGVSRQSALSALLRDLLD